MTEGNTIPQDELPGSMLDQKREKQAEEPPERKIFNQARGWHEQFIKEKWSTRMSFHNPDHLDAVDAAINALVDEAIAPEPTQTEGEKPLQDPLRVKEGVRKLLESSTDPKISKDVDAALPVLKKAVTIFAGLHDLGNIISGFKGESLEPEFLPSYQAKGAEERAKIMARKIIEQADLPAAEKPLITLFVEEIIDRTKYVPVMTDADREKPLGLLAAVSDQIGNSLFNKNDAIESAKGLVYENYREDQNATLKPAFFFNFASRRIAELVNNDTNIIKRVQQIWGKTLSHPNKTQLPEQEMTIDEFYHQYPEFSQEG